MLACQCLNIILEISGNATPSNLKLNMLAALSDAASFESVEFLKSVSLFVCATQKMPFYYNKRKEEKSRRRKKKKRKIIYNETPTKAISVSCNLSTWFRQASGPVKGKVSVQHDALVEQQKLDKWIIHHCLNCDSHVYATGEGANEEMMLINGNLIVSWALTCLLIKSYKHLF